MTKTKWCNRCREVKPAEKFSKNSCKKNGLQTFCKVCMAAQGKIYYQEHAKKMRRSSNSAYKKRIRRNKEWMRQYYEKHPCVDCGTDNVMVLECDHVRGKKRYTISRMLNDGLPIKKIKKELAKCEVVCANCHRVRTYRRNGGNYRTV